MLTLNYGTTVELDDDCNPDKTGPSVVLDWTKPEGNASERAYAAAAYLPHLEKFTIPRLELLGITLATKIVQFLIQQLTITPSSVQLLTDSQIALYWIHSNKQLKTFTNNRVRAIKEVLDELTKAVRLFHFRCTNSYSRLLRITSYVLKYIANLRAKIKRKPKAKLSSSALLDQVSTATLVNPRDSEAARLLLLREHYREGAAQLQSHAKVFQLIEDNGIYKVHLRMANAEVDALSKTPILLLQKHPLTRLIILDYHQKLFHAGSAHLTAALRNDYIIPKIRS
ncbi:hypothetical protein OSTOST_07885 [Ostertagia ostertagi]